MGVDIFFVISGFVITSSLTRLKKFNFVDFIKIFYQKRIIRLIPTLCFYLLIGGIFISFFRFDSSGSLNTALSSLFGLSNVALFWKSKDYFATSQSLNPFTHTWSIGVEAQFYLIYPFLIWLSGFKEYKYKGYKNIVILILFLATFSIISFIYLYPTNQPAAYFLISSRFWEIAVGCLLFFWIDTEGFLINKLKELNPAIFFLSILIVMLLPISYAVSSIISVVFLSALLILSIRKGTYLYKLLSNKFIVHIGSISYSLYLWHWGILSISRWTIGIHWWTIPFQILLMYLLSIFSYKFIEKPFKNLKESKKRNIKIKKIIIPLLLTSTLITFLFKKYNKDLFLGNPNKIKKNDYYSLNNNPKFCRNNLKSFNEKNVIMSGECSFIGNKNNKTLFFIGDSHNLAILPGAEYVALTTNSNLVYDNFNFYNKSSDEIIFPTTIGKEAIKRKKELIDKSSSGDIFFITNSLHKFIDGKANLENWIRDLEDFSNDLKNKNIKIIISTISPYFKFGSYGQCYGQNNQWFNKFSRKNCIIPLTKFSSSKGTYYQLNKRLEELVSKNRNIYLFNTNNALCSNNECSYYQNSQTLYRDAHHISSYSARYLLAPKILELLNKIQY